MLWNIHTEVILADAYAFFLVGVAVSLEFVARHSHHRSERFRSGGFVYKRTLDVWECPSGHHLKREKTDYDHARAHYRAPAHKCNSCAFKKYCTDSDEGRLLESRPDSWVQSELRRFHRVISLTLLLLAAIVLIAEMLRYREENDCVALLVLLLPISFAGSRHLVSFFEGQKFAQTDS